MISIIPPWVIAHLGSYCSQSNEKLLFHRSSLIIVIIVIVLNLENCLIAFPHYYTSSETLFNV